MIRWETQPDLLPDADLLREYQTTDGEDDRAEALLAEIERRGLDV